MQNEEPEATTSNDAMTEGVQFPGEDGGAGIFDIITLITSLGGY